MCGIWGGMSSANVNKISDFTKFAYAAALCGTLRGTHSTGIVLVDNKGEVITHKSPVPGGVFVETKEGREHIDLASESKVFFGHNRHATVGKIEYSTAHPFTHGHITLVHNGSVHGYLSDLRKYLEGYNPVNDSDAIAYALSVGDRVEVLESITGAYALVWWDAKEKRLYIARNSQRPLHVAFTTTHRMYWASEAEMLHWLLFREKELNGAEINFFEPGYLYSFAMDGPLKTSMTKERFTIGVSSWAGYLPGGNYYPKHQAGSSYGAATSRTVGAREKASVTSIGTTGRTSSQKLLEQVGVKQGEIFGFLPEDIKFKTQRSRHGEVTGSLVRLSSIAGVEEPKTETAVMYGVSRDEWEVMQKGGWCEVKVAGAFKDGSAIVVQFFSHGSSKIENVYAHNDRLYSRKGCSCLVAEFVWDTNKWVCDFCSLPLTSESIKKLKLDPKGPKKEQEAPLLPSGRTFRAGDRYVSMDEFMELVKDGCAGCRKVLGLADEQDITWVGVGPNKYPLCATCDGLPAISTNKHKQVH